MREEPHTTSVAPRDAVSDAPMDTLSVIAVRRSIGRMLPDSPPRHLIDTLLAAAVRAPNHHRTQPWFFHVLTGESRVTLGAGAADALAARGASEAAIAKARRTFTRAPVVIVATAAAGKDAMETRENRDAVCAAVQNILLAATALGLASMWRTGGLIDDPVVRTRLEIAPGTAIVGFISIGYPATDAPAPERPAHTTRSRWWSDDMDTSTGADAHVAGNE